MLAIENFIYKGIKKREAGSFITKEGKEVQYDEAYILKFDEIRENEEIFERKTKVDINDVNLISKLQTFKLYQPIILSFNVDFLKDNTAIIKLIDVDTVKQNKKSEDINE